MFKILVKGVIPHLYMYEISLTSKYMFKSLGKSYYRDRNVRANTKDRGQTIQGQQYFPFYQHVCDKSDDSQTSESQICIIHFLKGKCCTDGFCQYLKAIMVRCISKQSAVAEKVYIGVKLAVNLSEK